MVDAHGSRFNDDNPSLDMDSGSRPTCGTASLRVDAQQGTFVIVGGGAAGAVAAETMRQAGFRGRIILISREPYLPIDRIKLSKFLDMKAEKIFLYKPAYYEQLKIECILGRVLCCLAHLLMVLQRLGCD